MASVGCILEKPSIGFQVPFLTSLNKLLASDIGALSY